MSRSRLPSDKSPGRIPRIGWASWVHILKHPAITPVHGDALHRCIDSIPSRDVSHSCMSETGVAGLELGH